MDKVTMTGTEFLLSLAGMFASVNLEMEKDDDGWQEVSVTPPQGADLIIRYSQNGVGRYIIGEFTDRFLYMDVIVNWEIPNVTHWSVLKRVKRDRFKDESLSNGGKI